MLKTAQKLSGLALHLILSNWINKNLQSYAVFNTIESIILEETAQKPFLNSQEIRTLPRCRSESFLISALASREESGKDFRPFFGGNENKLIF